MANIQRSFSAGQRQQIGNAGKNIRVVLASGPITVYVNDDYYDVEEGARIEADGRFSSFEVKSEIDQTIILQVGDDKLSSNFLAGTVQLKPSGSLIGMPEIVLKKVYLSAPDTNSGQIWLGSTVANAGLPLEPGDVSVFDINGSIDFIGSVGDKLNAAEVV